mmetsp:Transcript_4151/g.17620  ORF Transcript_4151/g.17620 Transcript_4151/m.17620 type:complete len:200 (+) Transcript_4151:2506-3105(+)
MCRSFLRLLLLLRAWYSQYDSREPRRVRRELRSREDTRRRARRARRRFRFRSRLRFRGARATRRTAPESAPRASARASRPRGEPRRGSAVSPPLGRGRARAREGGRPARRRWGRASRRTRWRATRWIPGTRLGPRRRGTRARRRPPPGRPRRPRASSARPDICLRRATPSAGSTPESRRRCPGRGWRFAPVAGRTRPRR